MINNNLNPRLNNNIINRHSQMHPEFKMSNPNNINNNFQNTNTRIALNLNLNKNNNNNIKNNINPNNNIMNMKNMPKNLNTNNANYMNANINPNNNKNSTNTVIRALNMIRGEFRKKDEKIRTLQLKVADLEAKIKLIKNNEMNINYNDNINVTNKIFTNNYMNNNNNVEQKKLGKNFTFSEKYSGEEMNFNNNLQNQNNYLNNRSNKIQEINYNIKNNNYLINKEGNNIGMNYQNNSNNKYQVIDKNQQDSKPLQQKYSDVINDGQRENSIKTYSGSYNGWTKVDVKLYLKEAKSKLNPDDFKEFIRSIKLLTKSKGEGNIDRKEVVEKVMNLLGENNYDLFIKFKSIIGYNE